MRTHFTLYFRSLLTLFFTSFLTILLTLLAALLLVFAPVISVFAQVEHVPVVHPVYPLLMRWEAQRILPADFSSTVLPLQRKEVVAALVSARQHDSVLTEADRASLAGFEQEFRLRPSVEAHGSVRSTIFPSRTDSTQVLFSRLFSNDEKSVFVIADSMLTVNVVPLANLDVRVSNGEAPAPNAPVLSPNPPQALTGQRTQAISGVIGGRIFGTISNTLGFFLQATNGRILSGSTALLLTDPLLYQNLTLRSYDGRFFDFAESHLRLEKDWFYATIGRETRLIGSGYVTRGVMGNNAPVADAITLGAKFSGFEYRFMHFSLLGQPEPDPRSVGAGTVIPSKYMAYHRLAFRWAWGELGLSESVIYSRRGLDLTYLVPGSLLRATSNALRDRDNYQLMADLTLRPIAGVQLKMQHVLDDLRIPEIGRGWWANKAAWNVGVMLAPTGLPFDASVEYSRIEPYTFSHFDYQNAAVHDGLLFAGNLLPNSDELMAQVRFWYGNRYPITLQASWRRHGANEMAGDSTARNVGGNIFRTVRYRYDPQTDTQVPLDSERVIFLDGVRQDRFMLALAGGWELTRQWNVQLFYNLLLATPPNVGAGIAPIHSFRVMLRFDDF